MKPQATVPKTPQDSSPIQAEFLSPNLDFREKLDTFLAGGTTAERAKCHRPDLGLTEKEERQFFEDLEYIDRLP